MFDIIEDFVRWDYIRSGRTQIASYDMTIDTASEGIDDPCTTVAWPWRALILVGKGNDLKNGAYLFAGPNERPTFLGKSWTLPS